MTKLNETVDLRRECAKCFQRQSCKYFTEGSVVCKWAEQRITELAESGVDSTKVLAEFLKLAIFETERAVREQYPDAMKYLQQTCTLANNLLELESKGYKPKALDSLAAARLFGQWNAKLSFEKNVLREARQILISECDVGKTMADILQEFHLLDYKEEVEKELSAEELKELREDYKKINIVLDFEKYKQPNSFEAQIAKEEKRLRARDKA